MYSKLVEYYKAGKVSFRFVKTFNMDEYVGLDRNHHESYHYFMFHNLFKVRIWSKAWTGRWWPVIAWLHDFSTLTLTLITSTSLTETLLTSKRSAKITRLKLLPPEESNCLLAESARTAILHLTSPDHPLFPGQEWRPWIRCAISQVFYSWYFIIYFYRKPSRPTRVFSVATCPK